MRRLRRTIIVPIAVTLALSVAGVLSAATASAVTDGAPTAAAAAELTGGGSQFVTRVGSQLRLGGKQFRFGGSNTYYLEYSSQLMADRALEAAAAAGFQVMRPWAFFDIGVPGDPSTNVDPGAADKGVYFQYWDAAAGRPAQNEDPASGLPKLDYVVYKAKQLGIRLVMPFTNNWRDFGGMDQYVKWAGATYHDDFYSSPVIKGWYKAWMSYLMNRVNTYTGVKYKDDPTIMTWELGNEPRCVGSTSGQGIFPRSPACNPTLTTAWADEMTRHIKSVDRKHLVSVGDEGFFCDQPTSDDWTHNCNEGIDTVAFTRLPAVDVMSFHAYPDYWGKDLAWMQTWITDHTRAARKAGKAVMFGEFGWLNKANRNTVYRAWLDAFEAGGGNGALYWMLADERDDGTLYPDYDGFTVYCPTPVCTQFTNFAIKISGKQKTPPVPVADHDSVTTAFGTPATLSPLANDIAYVGSPRPGTIDLDPATGGRQTGFTVAGGTFALAADATVTFTPTEGFAGRAVASYTVADARRKISNVADITVTVQPDPDAAVVLFDFADGVQGFKPCDWGDAACNASSTTPGTLSGSPALHVSSQGAWFQADLSPAGDFTGKLFLKHEILGTGGFTPKVAVQVGPSWTWCEILANQTTSANVLATAEYDLTALAASCGPGLSQVNRVLFWINPGEYDIDSIRVE